MDEDDSIKMRVDEFMPLGGGFQDKWWRSRHLKAFQDKTRRKYEHSGSH